MSYAAWRVQSDTHPGVEEHKMSSDPNDPIRRAEEVEEDVAPRHDPGQSGGADSDDDVAPDATSTHD